MTNPVIVGIISAFVGILIRFFYEILRDRYRFKQELRDNNYIDVSGDDWYAAWQTCVENQVLVNTEHLSMQQKGGVVKVKNNERAPENPKGGYLWTSQMQFFQGKYLMGWYFPLKSENNASKGIMFFSYHSPKRMFYGKWVGAAYDGDLANGFLVISKNREDSRAELNRIMAVHQDKVNILFTAI